MKYLLKNPSRSDYSKKSTKREKKNSKKVKKETNLSPIVLDLNAMAQFPKKYSFVKIYTYACMYI